MEKFTFEIEQVKKFVVVIEADNLESAEAEFDEYLVEDFGAPVASHLSWEVN